MIFALMMTMLLGGLWHGASWNFVLWGFVHGLLLIVHRFGKEISAVIPRPLRSVLGSLRAAAFEEVQVRPDHIGDEIGE